MRIHVPGLPYVPMNSKYSICAFTNAIVQYCNIMTDQGHEVIAYGAQGSDVRCSEFIQTHPLRSIADTWGFLDRSYGTELDESTGNDLGYDMQRYGIRHDHDELTSLSKEVMIYQGNQIKKNKKRGDILALFLGYYQKIVMGLADIKLTVEPSIGYPASVAPFRVYLSNFMRSFRYGYEHDGQFAKMRYWDRVIPYMYDTKTFPKAKSAGENFFLFVGRLTHQKGLAIAIDATRELGKPLLIVGGGAREWNEKTHTLITQDETLQGDHIKYMGTMEPKERNELMSRAQAVYMPTLYLEPFGSVAVEAQLCGTPVITTDWGAFRETVKNSVGGYRCNTMQDFVMAGDISDIINRHLIKSEAMERYSPERLGKLHTSYLEDVSSTNGDPCAWYKVKPYTRGDAWFSFYENP